MHLQSLANTKPVTRSFIYGLVILLLASYIILTVYNSAQTAKQTNTHVLLLKKYMKSKGMDSAKKDYAKIVKSTLKFTEMFKIDPLLMYAIGIYESGLNAKAVNTNKSPDNLDIGVWQINIKAHGEDLGNPEMIAMAYSDSDFIPEYESVKEYLHNTEYNAFAACYVFKMKWARARGSLVKAVQLYNGSGPQTIIYAERVLTIYGELNTIYHK